MKLELSQSSILAAREIVKDNNIANRNKRLHEHNLSTYEYTHGQKILNYLEKKNLKNYLKGVQLNEPNMKD